MRKRCPWCGSLNTVKAGFVVSRKHGKQQRYQCMYEKCYRTFTDKTKRSYKVK